VQVFFSRSIPACHRSFHPGGKQPLKAMAGKRPEEVELSSHPLGQTMIEVEREEDRKAREAEAAKVRAGFKRPEWWVLYFGWTLAAGSGFTNLVSQKTFNYFATHVTGTSTNMGMGIAYAIMGNTTFPIANGITQQNDAIDTRLLPAVVVFVSFCIGAFLCGLLVDKNQIHLGGKNSYGLALIGTAAFLIAATVVRTLENEPERRALRSEIELGTPIQLVGIGLVAMASGLQNAMCTSHFGAIVRVTHVTGTSTDIGSNLGRMTMLNIRSMGREFDTIEDAEYSVDKKRIMVLVPMLFSYMIGAGLGELFESAMNEYAFLIPAGWALFAGLSYVSKRQSIEDAFTVAKQADAPKHLEEIAQQLGEESISLQELLEPHPDSMDHTSQFLKLAIEMEKIEKTLADAKDDILYMQEEYTKEQTRL